MAHFDLPVHELERYLPALDEPADLLDFWDATLAEARGHDIDVALEEVENHLALVTTYDVGFAGYGGHRIKGWLHVPTGTEGPLPTVVEYIGYTGGRGLPHQHVDWALAGYAHLVVDGRGQGWGGGVGDTPDPTPDAGLIAVPGHLTRGIQDPSTYYYRRVYTDAVRAVDAAAATPYVDRDQIAVAGISQGGGIAIAVAALRHDLVGALVDVPFLCHFRHAVSLTDNDPYAEITRYLKRHRSAVDTTFATLRYFDGAVLARHATAPTLFSTALMDRTCPPSTVFAAFNHWASQDKAIEVYEFNQHEGGEEHHQRLKYEWLGKLFG